ncbi:eukaryotic aspartyl protease [Opisthorchis viverrini]|uniref:Eukaryotic aspartyl protease n=1 Tax=Opisthorchis viverrini TaxID=6198 RepID=A0A1S8WWN4_OPIVI|nr:eukaryotic aspartyl protease [Opisthorchis viverrini]
MVLDTGSPSIWVPSDNVDRNLWVGKNLLSMDRTTSLQVSEEAFHQRFSSCEVIGVKATVHMKLGDTLIRNVPFGLVKEGSTSIARERFDGTLGLGRRRPLPENTDPIFQFVHRQGLMGAQFGFDFQDSGASFMMGDHVEQAISTADMTFVNVIEGPFWETRATCISISVLRLNTEEHRMIFDTGTHTIVLPETIHMAINQVLGISTLVDGSYEFDCEMLPSMRPIAFHIQEKAFHITPTQYTKQTRTNGGTKCYTRFITKPAGFHVGIILGMPFLHSFQLIFDDEAGRVGLAPRHGKSSIVQFYCAITIEQTEFLMLLDTGSPSIWIPSDRVDRSLWVEKTLLNVAQTSSLQISREIFYEEYGTGEISGLKATVDMELGGMLIRNVPFGLVMEATRSISEEPVDGYIGLGRPPICSENTIPLPIFVRERGLMSGQFGFEFQDDGATFIMGDNLEQVIPTGSMAYVNVVDGSYWEMRIDRISISNTEISTEDHRAIFDTGTHTMVLPGDIHMAINRKLGISRLVDGAYVFECARLPSMRPIAFHIQGKKFHITRTQYTKQTTVNGDAMCSTRFLNNSVNTPLGIILGMSFLRSFQLIFDHQASRVGFAPRHGRSSID